MTTSPLRPAPKPVPPEKAAKRRAKQRGKYAEKRIADLLGGEPTISSGRTALQKGDVWVSDLNLFVEVKYCGVRQGRGDTSVTFDREWLEKTILDAEAVGMLPLIALRFRDGSGCYATTADIFERLIEKLHFFKQGSDTLDDLLVLFPDETKALLAKRDVILKRANTAKDR